MHSDLWRRFQLGLGLVMAGGFSALAQDVSSISLYRSGYFEQTQQAPPVPIPSSDEEVPFFVLAVMEMSGDFLSDPDNLLFVRGVTLQPPTGSLRGMDFFEEFGGFVYYQEFLSQTALQSAFRSGSYTYTFDSFLTGESEYVLGVDETQLPSPAEVLNFASAQSIPAGAPYTLRWTPDSPALGGVRVEIYDQADGMQVFDSEPRLGALSSLELPGTIFQAGHTYLAEITFTRFDSPDGSSGSVALTRVPLASSSGNVPAPVINTITLNGSGEAVLLIQCTPGVPLLVQQSNSLSGGWETSQTVNPTASPATVTLPTASLSDVAFLRALQ
ncbi:MAG: hypothetical protein J0M24_12110 [Verrucomicrobia bacterium]|nr:hypothetical protein [Verrucomicrobiota bacterium]